MSTINNKRYNEQASIKSRDDHLCTKPGPGYEDRFKLCVVATVAKPSIVVIRQQTMVADTTIANTNALCQFWRTLVGS